MGANSKLNRQTPLDEAPGGKAVTRADLIERALAGKGVPTVLDSSGNAIASPSTLTAEESQAAKAALRASIFRDA